MKENPPSSLDGYERGVYTTLDLSYRVIPQPAQKFFHFISFFHHTAIPIAVLATAARNKFEDESPLLPHPKDHEHIVKDLRELMCLNGKWS